MQQPRISQAEIEARIGGHLDELLKLWWAEQGASKPHDLHLIASALPLPCGEAVRVLDLCCGPGDVGRAIRRQYPNAQIDCVDRDPFLASICAGVNRRDQVSGKIVIADLKDPGWQHGLSDNYDAVATVNALHQFEVQCAQQLFQDIHALLRSGGVFIFSEPAAPETPFATGFGEWKAKQPSRYSRENWVRFWSAANRFLGYDHIKLMEPRAANQIDDSMSVAGWTRMLRRAGFALTDVLLRDADQVIIAGMKS
ncbi:MAG: class I SAM-dependent methyltransferase [Gammaproteobacteria bacterium]